MTSTTDFARRLARIERNLRRLSTQPQLGRSSFEGGAIQEFDPDTENVVQVIGQQWDGTHAVANFNGPTPPTPAGFTLEPMAGALRVNWDGEFESDADGNLQVSSMDWVRAEVHVSTSPIFDTNLTSTLMTTFDTPRGGSKDIAIREPGTQYVRLLSRSQSGKRSPDSVMLSVDVDWELAVAPTTTPVGTIVEGIGALHVLWPVTANPSGYDVEVHVTLDDTPPTVGDPRTLVKTTRGTLAIIDRMPDGSDLQQDVIYRVWLIATNNIGSADVTGPITGTLRKINTPDIAVDAAWVGTMSVEQLDGGILRADTVVGSGGGVYAQGTNGERAGIFPTGIKVSGGAAVDYKTYIDFPTSGAPNIVSGILRATTLEVDGDEVTGRAMNLRGKSELAQSAELRMAVSPQPPISGPIVTGWYPSVDINWNGFPAANMGYVRGGFYDPGTSLTYFIDGYANRVYWMDAGAVVRGSISLAGMLPWTSASGSPSAYGVTKAGGFWHVLHSSFVNGYPYLAVTRFNETWSVLATWYPSIGNYYYGRFGSIGTDGTNVVVAARNYTDDLVMGYYSATVPNNQSGSAQLTRTVTSSLSSAGWAKYGGVRAVIAQPTDLGSSRIIIAQLNRVLAFTTAASSSPRVTADEWPLDADATVLWWAGSGATGKFRSLSSTGLVSDYSAYHPAAGTKAFFASTRYSSAGYETVMSPISSIEITPRAWIKVTASYGGAPGSRIYGATGLFTPSRNGLYLQSTLTAPTDTVLYGSPLALSTGIPPLATDRPFPNSNPAQIISNDGSTYWKADGTSKFRETILTSAVDVTAAAGNTPALRVGDPAGWHMRLDGNQIQAMTDDSHVKTLSLNIEQDASGNSGGIELGRGARTFRSIRMGSNDLTANASGADTINHGGSGAPDIVVANRRAAGTTGFIEYGSYGATTFTVTMRHADGTLFTSGQTTTVDWIAIWL